MTREIAPIAARSAGGGVLRGVVLAAESRALARPGAGAATRVVAAVASVIAPIAVQAAAPHARPSAEEGAREREAAVRAGHEEGRAQGHAEALRTAAAEGREQGFRQGQEEGHRQGLEQGRAAALRQAEDAQAEARRLVAERVQQLDGLLQALPAEIARHLEQAQDDMLGLCFDAVAQVLGSAAAGAEGTRAMVREALAQAAVRGAVTVRVNPRDLDAVRREPGVDAGHGPDCQLHWVADERVQLGGCVIASAEGGLDARLETQLARLAALLESSRHEQGETR